MLFFGVWGNHVRVEFIKRYDMTKAKSKKWACGLAALLAMGCLGGCKGGDTSSSSNPANGSLEEVKSGLLY